MVSRDTDINIEFNNLDIKLSADEENAFKNILNSTRIYRSLSSFQGPYHIESTIFIRIHDRDKNGTIRGVLTVCFDGSAKSNFLGSEPNGWFRVNKADIQELVDFLVPIIMPLDT